MSTHTLVVTLDALTPAEQYEYDHGDAALRRDLDRDRLRFTIECSGVDQGCRMWLECMPPHDVPEEIEDALEGEMHGVHHQWLDGMWCIETDHCSLSGVNRDRWEESARTLAEVYGVGRYPVVHTWEDDYIEVERARELADARAS
jgi:hypothetical protein